MFLLCSLLLLLTASSVSAAPELTSAFSGFTSAMDNLITITGNRTAFEECPVSEEDTELDIDLGSLLIILNGLPKTLRSAGAAAPEIVQNAQEAVKILRTNLFASEHAACLSEDNQQQLRSIVDDVQNQLDALVKQTKDTTADELIIRV